MIKKPYLLLVLGVAAILLVTPRLSRAQPVEPHCCVCGPCSSGPSRVCVSVAALGNEETHCAEQCGEGGCQFLEVLDGSCGLHAAECTPPSPAPAASRPVLFVLAALLAGGGIYLVRRRVTH